MSIASALTALNGDIEAARDAIEAKGGTVTTGGGSSQLANDIVTIPSGSGDNLPDFLRGTMKNVTIPGDVTTIRECIFKGTEVENVIIENGVTTIAASVFENCINLISLHIPKSLKYFVGARIFRIEGKQEPLNIYIDAIVDWYEKEFSYSNSNPLYVSKNSLIVNGIEIHDLVVPDGIEAIGRYAFYKCSQLSSITIASSVKSIGTSAFSDCHALAIDLSEGLEEIGEEALRSNSISAITIPASVTTILTRAFRVCANLTEIKFNGTPTTIAANAFEATKSGSHIYCPWSEGEVAGAPWGAVNATIHYNYTPEE